MAPNRPPGQRPDGGARGARSRQGRIDPAALAQQPAGVRGAVGCVQAGRRCRARQFSPRAARNRLHRRELPGQGDHLRFRVRRTRGGGARGGGGPRTCHRHRRTGRRGARLRRTHGGAWRRPRVRGRGGPRRSAVAVLHLGYDRPAQGGDPDARPDGLRGHQYVGRSVARPQPRGCPDSRRPSIARRRRPLPSQRRARRQDGADVERPPGRRGMLAAD